ncbi:BTB And Kelch, partial [Teladorsagia circumcincta]
MSGDASVSSGEEEDKDVTEKENILEFEDVVCTEEFYQLPVDRLIELISNEELHVRSEEQVFTAVVQWIKFDLATRQQFLAKLLEHVRFSLCNPKFIVDTISKDELVMTDAACRNFVDEAKDYLLLQSYAHEVPNKQKPRMRPRKRPMCNKVLY